MSVFVFLEIQAVFKLGGNSCKIGSKMFVNDTHTLYATHSYFNDCSIFLRQKKKTNIKNVYMVCHQYIATS